MKRTAAALYAPRRMTQFVSVGAVGAILETFIVAVLTTTVAFQPVPAKVIGAEVSISTMFVLNDRYTFAGEGALGTSNVVHRWAKSHAARATGLAVAFVVLWYLTARTEIHVHLLGANVWPTIPNVIGLGAALTINCVTESVITWNVIQNGS